jgi:hypothetical protein
VTLLMTHHTPRRAWVAVAAVLALVAAHAALFMFSGTEISLVLVTGLVSLAVMKYTVWRFQRRG